MNESHLNNWLNKRKSRRFDRNLNTLLEDIKLGKVEALGTAITILESTRSDDKEFASQLIKECLPFSGKSIRIGITGVPGVGKSSFIEVFGKYLLSIGKKVAVLAIDPSSEMSGGSILGDKTRMEELSAMENVFIRPTPSGNTLGGVARKTRESIFLCETAGYDVILIETVGVGQSETMVHSMVDFFLLLMLSGAGDELQGIKRGIMEMADALLITKADGDNINKSKTARKEYQNAMHLFPPKSNGWIPKAMICSSMLNEGINNVWKTIESFQNTCVLNNSFHEKRQQQDKYWFHESLKEFILDYYLNNDNQQIEIKDFEDKIMKGELTSFQAAENLFNKIKNGN